MMRKWMVTGAGLLWIALGVRIWRGEFVGRAAGSGGQAKPAYTLAEYNAYKDADGEQNPQQKSSSSTPL